MFKLYDRSAYFSFALLGLLATASLPSFSQTQKANKNAKDLFDPKIPDDYVKIALPDQPKTWGAYNVHDPSAIKVGDWYYVYSTDAVYGQRDPKSGIHIRKSKDLTHFEFVGWAFDSIPDVAMQGVMKANNGRKPGNIWAPYILKYKDIFRLYYSVSVFGSDASFIGMAESKSPVGPWVQKGKVVATRLQGGKNAIDPTVVTNETTGEQWMAYGSCFGGIFMLQLDPTTGLAMRDGDEGHLIASRDNVTSSGCGKGEGGIDGVSNIEGPDIIYNPDTKKYYLFVSYDWLFDTYNVRVGRADKPEGPYLDFEGKDMTLNTNHLPIVTHAYQFEKHSGWQGMGHCGVMRDGKDFYMFNQGRPCFNPGLINLHVRKIVWDKQGWPSVFPERFVKLPNSKLNDAKIAGTWEYIILKPENGKPIPSKKMVLLADHKLKDMPNSSWKLNGDMLTIDFGDQQQAVELKLADNWDWELNQRTVAFTGLNSKGLSVWGKRVKGTK